MRLSTGKEIYANGDIFGLGRDGQITEGYDCIIDYGDYSDEDSRLTDQERLEVCDAMILRWSAYRGKVASQIQSQSSYPQVVEKPAT